MAQDQMMAEQAAPAEGGEESGQDQFMSLVQNVSQGLAMLKEVVTDAGVSPQIAEKLAQATAIVDEAVTEMSGGAPAGQPGGEGVASMEAGASGAQPMSPAQR